MDDTDFVAEALEALLPDDAEWVGVSNLREIAAGPVEIIPLENGSKLAYTEAVLTLAAWSVIIRNALEVCTGLARAWGRPLTSAEVQTAVEAGGGFGEGEPLRQDTPAMRSKLYELVAQRLRRERNAPFGSRMEEAAEWAE